MNGKIRRKLLVFLVVVLSSVLIYFLGKYLAYLIFSVLALVIMFFFFTLVSKIFKYGEPGGDLEEYSEKDSSDEKLNCDGVHHEEGVVYGEINSISEHYDNLAAPNVAVTKETSEFDSSENRVTSNNSIQNRISPNRKIEDLS